MTRTLTTALAVITVSLAPSTFCFAQDAAKASPGTITVAPSRDPRGLEYERTVKDLKKIDGPFTFYQRKRDLLLEIPESRLGQPFLIQAAFETGLDTGMMHAGMSIGDQAVDAFQWEKQDDIVNLVRPNLTHRWQKDNAFAVGAERTFPKAILSGFRIEQYDPERHLILINVTSLFYGDLFYLPQMVAGALGGPYMMDRERSAVDSAKGFDDSSVVTMKLHFASPRGADTGMFGSLLGLGENTLEDDRSAPVKVTYSMWYRNEDGYVPRVADPRIGYFTQDFFSVDRYLTSDRTERFIDRFNLKKKDPKAPTSEAVKPIVWTIDPSIPPAYRPAVKEGILRWNKAFEALGYKNAIQVADAPTDGTYDHADGRRNVIRMSVGPSSMFAAISLPRTDPFTGEILNASITIDGNVVREMFSEHDSTEMSAAKVSLTKSESILTRDDARKETDDHFLFATDRQRAQEKTEAFLSKFGWKEFACDYAEELGDAAALNWYAVEASSFNGISREDYVKKYISDCVCHELGHCLGLRHNFAGSTYLSTDQLANDTLTSTEGTTASVMDYMPPNVQAVLKGHGNFYSPTIGVYDKWAIQYGYSDSGSKSPESEKPYLATIARQSGLPGHGYMTDEDADGFNPYAVRFDGGKDPLTFSALELTALRRARNFAVQRLPENGQSYRVRTEVVLSSIVRSFREGRNAARFVGGLESSKNFKGDAGEKPTLAPVDAASQRKAMNLIAQEFLSPSSFDLPASVLSSLTFGDDSPTWTAPVRDFIGANQHALVAMVMSAGTTDRIAENAFKVGTKGSYSLDEHYGLLMGAVFKEVGNGLPIAPLRRDLQRFVLSGLMIQAGAPEGAVSDDVRMIANDSLRRLSARLATAKGKAKLDDFTKVYLNDSCDEIRRFMSRLSTTR
jgi:hypothetical protein